MNNENGGLYFGAGIDNSQLRTDAAESKKILGGIGDKVVSEGDKIDAAMKKIGASVAGVFAVSKVKEFVSQVANVRGEFQQIEIAFKTMLGSADKANALMQQIIKTAATTPFNMSDVAQGAKQLLAYGVQADKVNETLIRLGDIASGLSIPLNDLAYLYGTTMVQGRLYTQDLNQFLGRGIPLTDELAKQFGVAKNKVKDLVTEGKVGFPEVEKAIIAMTSEGGKFGGLMEAQSHTITGQLSNLEDGFEQMFNEIGKSTEGIISDTISVASSVVENWRNVGDVLLGVIATYGAYKAAVISAAAVQGAIKTVKHTEEAAQLYEVMTAEQQAKISKMNLSKTSEEYYLAVKAETQAEMERQTQLAVTTQTELTAARERLAVAEREKAVAAEKVASKRSELEAVVQEAATEQTVAVQKKIAIESEAQSRAALRAQKLQEQKDTAISQARALKEAQASEEVVAAKNREIATINKKLVAAKAEEVQHSRNIVALRKEMAATVDATTSKKVAKATTALETAEENLSTAAKARNTAAREVSSKAALLDSTVRRANTVETAANTAAQTANATATGFLSVAKRKLTAVASRLNAVIMANPWALALAAVVALGYGIYKLITYQTDEQKAQNKLNDATKEYNKTVAAEQVQIDSMFARLKTAKKGTEEYKNAKQAIISQYGKYLDGLQSEVKNLNDVEAAYRAVSSASRDAAKARAMEAFTKDAADTYASTESKQKEKLYQFLKDKFGDQKTKGGMSRAENVYWQLVRVIEGKGKLNENWVKQFDKTHYVSGDPYTGIGSYTYTTNDIREIISKVIGAKITYNKAMEEAARRFGDSPIDKKTETKPTEVVKNKKYWEDYQKEQQGFLDAMTAAELKTKKAAKIKANIKQAQKNIDAYSVSKTTAAGDKAHTEAVNIENQTADRLKDIEKYKKDIIAANTKAELDIRQQKLESLQDGFDKELQLIELNYDRLVAENAERERQMLEALADNKLREWLNKNPKATKQQQLDYRLNLLNPKNENRLTAADLTSEQRAQLAAYAKVAVDIKVQAERSLYNRLMDEYQDYETRRKEVHRKHDEDRRSLEAAPIDTTAKEAAIAELERKRKEALKNINNEQAESIQKSSDLFVKLFSDTSEKSGKEISKIISQTEKLLNYLKNTAAVDITPKFGFTAEQLKSLQASPEKLKEYTEQFKRLKEAVRKGNPFKVLAKDISNLFKKNKDSDKDSGIEARLKKLGASASESADMVAGLSEKLSKMFEAAGNESMAQAMSDVTDIMNSVSNIGKGFAEGGLIGGISAAVGEGIGWVTKAFEASARHAAALKEIMEEVTSQQRAYNLALLDESLAFEKAITIFGTLDYMKSNNAVDVMRKAWAELRKEIEGTIAQQRKFEYDQTKDLFWGARYNRNGKLKSDYSGLADIFIKTGHEKTGLFGWGKGKDIYTSLLDVYPELIDKQGRFNIELAKTIIDTRTFNGEGKEALQYMIELAEKAEEAYKGVKDYLVGIFGELGNTLSDALVEAFRNGTDAADSFGDSVAKMLGKIGEQMIFSAMFSQIIQQANDAMLNTMTNVSLTEEQKFNRYVEILDTMTTGILGQQDNYNALMKRYQELAKVKGIDLWKSEEKESREASKKGIASASQESIDELNGRATSIQGHTFSISENTKLLLDTSNRILLSVLNIESNTNGLSDRVGGVERNVNEIKNVVNEISVKGIKIR